MEEISSIDFPQHRFLFLWSGFNVFFINAHKIYTTKTDKIVHAKCLNCAVIKPVTSCVICEYSTTTQLSGYGMVWVSVVLLGYICPLSVVLLYTRSLVSQSSFEYLSVTFTLCQLVNYAGYRDKQ
jgi:hypothetical protein